jgi:hypothetical protein
MQNFAYVNYGDVLGDTGMPGKKHLRGVGTKALKTNINASTSGKVQSVRLAMAVVAKKWLPAQS